MKIGKWQMEIRRGWLRPVIFGFVVLLLATTALLIYSHRPARALGTTKYAVNAGGNWTNNTTWSTVATKDASRVADTVAPTAEDDVILDDYSGAVTIGVETWSEATTTEQLAVPPRISAP